MLQKLALAELYFPAGQLSHFEAFLPEYVPALQSKHLDEPFVE